VRREVAPQRQPPPADAVQPVHLRGVEQADKQ
jgi:hypothetical protein